MSHAWNRRGPVPGHPPSQGCQQRRRGPPVRRHAPRRLERADRRPRSAARPLPSGRAHVMARAGSAASATPAARPAVSPVSSGPEAARQRPPAAQPVRHVAHSDAVIGRRIVAQDHGESCGTRIPTPARCCPRAVDRRRAMIGREPPRAGLTPAADHALTSRRLSRPRGGSVEALGQVHLQTPGLPPSQPLPAQGYSAVEAERVRRVRAPDVAPPVAR